MRASWSSAVASAKGWIHAPSGVLYGRINILQAYSKHVYSPAPDQRDCTYSCLMTQVDGVVTLASTARCRRFGGPSCGYPARPSILASCQGSQPMKSLQSRNVKILRNNIRRVTTLQLASADGPSSTHKSSARATAAMATAPCSNRNVTPPTVLEESSFPTRSRNVYGLHEQSHTTDDYLYFRFTDFC